MTIPPHDPAIADESLDLLPAPIPLDGFAAEEFRARRDALRSACADGLVLIRGSAEDETLEGSAARYRQNSNFFYLTGVAAPGAALALLPEGVSARSGIRGEERDVREVLFLPPRDRAREQWTGAQIGPGADAERATGIAATASSARLMAALGAWIRRNPVVYTIAPFGEQAQGSRQYALMRRVSEQAPVAQFRDCASAVARLRCVKSPAEVNRLREAIAVTGEGQRAARALIAAGAGRRECQAEARVHEAFRARGATQAFAPIVGGGRNATVLHYDQNSAELIAGDLVVVDIGARVGAYCGDVTRTYPVGGTFGPRQREIYELVLAARRAAIEGFSPGKDRIDDLTRRCKEALRASTLRVVDDGKERTMDYFMPHNIGHHLGLDVHDVGDLERPLEPGAVITIEPGVYLQGEGIGVRIEDDFLVTPAGLECLGPPLEFTVDEVERAMRS